MIVGEFLPYKLNKIAYIASTCLHVCKQHVFTLAQVAVGLVCIHFSYFSLIMSHMNVSCVCS